MISVRFQGKPFNITVIQAYAPTSNTEEAEIEQFYEDLQDFLELTPPQKKMDDMMAIINCSLFLMPSIDTKVDNIGLLDLIIFIIFKCTISVVLNRFSLLCYHHYHPFPENFHHPKLKRHTH